MVGVSLCRVGDGDPQQRSLGPGQVLPDTDVLPPQLAANDSTGPPSDAAYRLYCTGEPMHACACWLPLDGRCFFDAF